MPQTTLLTLPAEIRLHIYTYLLPPLSLNCAGALVCERSSLGIFPAAPICRQISCETRALYMVRHHVHVEVFQGRVICLVPHGFPGCRVPVWKDVLIMSGRWKGGTREGNRRMMKRWEVKNKGIKEKGNEIEKANIERRRYPDFLKGCKNVIIRHRDFRGVDAHDIFSSIELLFKEFLPTVDKAQRVKIQFTNWRKGGSAVAEIRTSVMESQVPLDKVEEENRVSSEARFIEMMRTELDGIPGLEEYCVVDKFSSVVCSRGTSWVAEWERSEVLSLMEL